MMQKRFMILNDFRKTILHRFLCNIISNLSFALLVTASGLVVTGLLLTHPHHQQPRFHCCPAEASLSLEGQGVKLSTTVLMPHRHSNAALGSRLVWLGSIRESSPCVTLGAVTRSSYLL